MEFHAIIPEDDGSYWAEVQELPGCFASGADMNELQEAVLEAIEMYLADGKASPAAGSARIDELRIAVPA
jgi:predicted RNase H-like HicB family nuclease